jgi:hypothetical protein
MPLAGFGPFLLDADSGLALTVEGRHLNLKYPGDAANRRALVNSTSVDALKREILVVPFSSLNLKPLNDLGPTLNPLTLALVSNMIDETPAGPKASFSRDSHR